MDKYTLQELAYRNGYAAGLADGANNHKSEWVYGDNSEMMLKRKLKLAGFSSDTIEEATEKMLSLGYINVTRQLDRLISVAVNKNNLGKRKIIPKLIAKGYKRVDIEESVNRLLLSGEIDFSLAMQRLRAKLPEDATDEEIKKYLYKFGHDVCLEDL
jgi:SOS response regulatory protein OraA/RecX